ncbi:NAD(P)/FAD-dependent oxidoreductase [Alteromonas sp. C1M14]|uniref:NAD(P)/FAD-dependent oxidoreductase n=1 Tax=Alteromonas sp. C1M14 TaxID=2841567 RepID=UPI001C098503|nr:tryptophan 7-halogenase [Alteromonas sp. C1M14]
MTTEDYDVVIIGAGPAGALAGSLLAQAGWRVLALEKSHFPRFSIGESLLPQSMVYLEAAGFTDRLHAHAKDLGFQFKDGAAFAKNGHQTHFNFNQKFTPGPGTTYQVKRAAFDKLLADEAQNKGLNIRFGHQVTRVELSDNKQLLDVNGDAGDYKVSAQFVLDASGFGRVLPRLLDLHRPSSQPTRKAIFTHVEDNISDPSFDRNKILISVHPQHEDIWYWLIPFSDGTCSLGVVGLSEQIQSQNSPLATLQRFVAQSDNLQPLLANAQWQQEAKTLGGYSASVCSLHGKGYALLGNAGEFLDPVFSSGVTIALHSASLIAPLVDRILHGESVDLEKEYAEPLKQGIDCFRTFVNAWYTGEFQTVIFSAAQQDKVRDMISSILAGYAWDTTNPYVAQSERRLRVLHSVCKEL